MIEIEGDYRIGTEYEVNKLRRKSSGELVLTNSNIQRRNTEFVNGKFVPKTDGTCAGEWGSPVWNDIEQLLIDSEDFWNELLTHSVSDEQPIPFNDSNNSSGQHTHIGKYEPSELDIDEAKKMAKAIRPILPLLYYFSGNSVDNINYPALRCRRLIGEDWARPMDEVTSDHYNECSYNRNWDTLELRGFDCHIPQVIATNVFLVNKMLELHNNNIYEDLDMDKYKSERKRVTNIDNSIELYTNLVIRYFDSILGDINLRNLPTSIQELIVLLFVEGKTPLDLMMEYVNDATNEQEKWERIGEWFDRQTTNTMVFLDNVNDLVNISEIPDVKWMSELLEMSELESEKAKQVKKAFRIKRDGVSDDDDDDLKNQVKMIRNSDNARELFDGGIEPDNPYLKKIKPDMVGDLKYEVRISGLRDKYGKPIDVGRLNDFIEWDISKQEVANKIADLYNSEKGIDKSVSEITGSDRTYFGIFNVDTKLCVGSSQTKINDGEISNLFLIEKIENKEQVMNGVISTLVERMNGRPYLSFIDNSDEFLTSVLSEQGFEKTTEIRPDKFIWVYNENPSEFNKSFDSKTDELQRKHREWAKKRISKLTTRVEPIEYNNEESEEKEMDLMVLLNNGKSKNNITLNWITNNWHLIEGTICYECGEPISTRTELLPDSEEEPLKLVCSECDNVIVDELTRDEALVVKKLINKIRPGSIGWTNETQLSITLNNIVHSTMVSDYNETSNIRPVDVVDKTVELNGIACPECGELLREEECEFVSQRNEKEDLYTVKHNCGTEVLNTMSYKVAKRLKERMINPKTNIKGTIKRLGSYLDEEGNVVSNECVYRGKRLEEKEVNDADDLHCECCNKRNIEFSSVSAVCKECGTVMIE